MRPSKTRALIWRASSPLRILLKDVVSLRQGLQTRHWTKVTQCIRADSMLTDRSTTLSGLSDAPATSIPAHIFHSRKFDTDGIWSSLIGSVSLYLLVGGTGAASPSDVSSAIARGMDCSASAFVRVAAKVTFFVAASLVAGLQFTPVVGAGGEASRRSERKKQNQVNSKS